MSHDITKIDDVKFYSVEFTDEEGELNIKHVFMTETEKLELLEKFRSNGISAAIYQLSLEPPAVSSEDGE